MVNVACERPTSIFIGKGEKNKPNHQTSVHDLSRASLGIAGAEQLCQIKGPQIRQRKYLVMVLEGTGRTIRSKVQNLTRVFQLFT